MTTYQFRRGSRLSGDADAVGTRLEDLRAKYGELLPEIVEKDARSKRSPLHDLFEWDDTAAALQHRLGQAAHVIRCIVVIDDPAAPEPHTAYVRVEVEEEPEGVDEEPVKRSSYQSTAVVMSDAELRAQVLDRALHELELWQKRYDELFELAAVFAAIKKTKTAIKKKAAA